MASFTHFSRNGVVLPIEQAVISTFNISYAYGFGVYESIRVVRGTAYFLKDHAKRLMHSASVIGLIHSYTADDIEKFVIELVNQTSVDAFNIKILLIGGRKPEDCELQILPLSPVFPEKKWYRDGVQVTSMRYERLFPQAKTLNMLGSYIAYDKARSTGAYDCLLLDHTDCITEGTRTNFFAIKNRVIVSPPLEQILDGITRMHVLEVAAKHGYSVEHRSVPLSSIATFDGAFLTSTSSKVLPIRTIDSFSFDTIHADVIELSKWFEEFLNETVKD